MVTTVHLIVIPNNLPKNNSNSKGAFRNLFGIKTSRSMFSGITCQRIQCRKHPFFLGDMFWVSLRIWRRWRNRFVSILCGIKKGWSKKTILFIHDCVSNSQIVAPGSILLLDQVFQGPPCPFRTSCQSHSTRIYALWCYRWRISPYHQ